jgi:hypothetical protein
MISRAALRRRPVRKASSLAAKPLDEQLGLGRVNVISKQDAHSNRADAFLVERAMNE